MTNKMNYFMLVLGIWILPKADTLQCYECTPGPSGNCTDQIINCPTQSDRCYASRETKFAGGSKVSDVTTKGCDTTWCFESSMNFGIFRSQTKTSCCTGNLCNTQVPDSSSSPNGGKCFTCYGNSCTNTLNCEGIEDLCFTSTGEETFKGCASKNMCTDAVIASMAQHGTEHSCCQGNYCNSATGTSAGPLLLMVSLTSLVFFS